MGNTRAPHPAQSQANSAARHNSPLSVRRLLRGPARLTAAQVSPWEYGRALLAQPASTVPVTAGRSAHPQQDLLRPTPWTSPVAHACLVKSQLSPCPPGRVAQGLVQKSLCSVCLPRPARLQRFPPPPCIFSGPCSQMKGGRKEKPSSTRPRRWPLRAKHAGKPAHGSSRRCCQLPTCSAAMPKPEVSGLCMPQPGNSPMPQISRHGDCLKSLQPLDVGTHSSSAVTGPGDAPSWDAHPAIHNSCSCSSRPASMPMCSPGSLPTHRQLDRDSAARQ